MISRRLGICCAAMVLALAIIRPEMPVVAGVGLVICVLLSAGRGFSASSAIERRQCFTRTCALSAVAFILILAGAHISAPWTVQVHSAQQARQAMLSLLVYSIALFGAPAAAWMHVSGVMRSGVRIRRVQRVPVYVTRPIQRCRNTRSRMGLLGRPSPLHGHYALCERKAG